MLTVSLVLVAAAVVMTLVYSARHDWVPLWVPVLLLGLAQLLTLIPLR